MNKKKTDFVVVGFALFSMFFGAGNLIFPPLLGRNLGPAYIAGIIGFIITGVGIPLLGLLASIRIDGQFELLAENVGRKFSTLYAVILFILIGPLLAIPRTAATTFEIAILPNFPNANPLIMILIFFAINLIFVLKPSKVIDNLGKFLTPILILILFTLVFKGVLHPISNLSTQIIPNALSSSLLEGYQTMDAIASIIFASVILGSIKAKGYKGKAIKKVTIKASLIAVSGLAIIYGGLTFLGARTGTLATDLTKSELLIYLSRNILGVIGTTAIGVSMALACLTTSIGLLSAGGSFFERISKGKCKYTFNVLAMTAISIFVANMGL
ncbi:MAG: branched-chain amino acid transport system II carrier protein, partial [Sarcina sp.]